MPIGDFDEEFASATRKITICTECEVRPVGVEFIRHIVHAARELPVVCETPRGTQIQQVVAVVFVFIGGIEPIGTLMNGLEFDAAPAPVPAGTQAAQCPWGGIDLVAGHDRLATCCGAEVVGMPGPGAGHCAVEP